MRDIDVLNDSDRSSVLHPFAQLKDFATGKSGPPTIMTGGKGIRVQDASGRLLYGCAGDSITHRILLRLN